MINCFSGDTLPAQCDKLARQHKVFAGIIKAYGYPPFWSRTPSFATLVHIILEQQVSLASAKAAFLKLQEKTGHITPAALLALTDEEMRACYFSRQKTGYARALAQAVLNNSLQLETLPLLNDEDVRKQLTAIKGIGNWTADVFLMMTLHRTDCFPGGDIALLASVRENLSLPASATKDEILSIATAWSPLRTVAAFMLWHAYIEKRGIKIN
ncbi:DNA-3-methyladenine glycosylase family protein [Deminuibacter soli]|uniref:DNA-3-methyladenine glycosylase II n=1 Tax=Deminuibacter soli TaxID=2291815 RepID=A0A3E1NQL3_9BACT|nr:DNA-3-methyladenine glycosylase [Deminuibacter soli]RFM30213.1 DNA-3-methyladenine glycosylase 2 family protein [Deminuibacter soli]